MKKGRQEKRSGLYLGKLVGEKRAHEFFGDLSGIDLIFTTLNLPFDFSNLFHAHIRSILDYLRNFLDILGIGGDINPVGASRAVAACNAGSTGCYSLDLDGLHVNSCYKVCEPHGALSV